MKNLKFVSKTYEIDKKKYSLKALSQELRNEGYDLVLSPHQFLRSAILAKSTGAHLSIGFKTWWNTPFFSERFKRPMQWPDALRQLSLLQKLDPQMYLQISQWTSEVDTLRKTPLDIPEKWSLKTSLPPVSEGLLPLLPETKWNVFLAPGSQWNTKRWTISGFAEVGRYYSDLGFGVYILGNKNEEDLCRQLSLQIPLAVNICGKTKIEDLPYWMEKAQMLICNDSGLMHMAAIVGLPTVSIFGPTVLEIGYRPWQKNALVVERDLICRPCGRHGHDKCPLGTHECMTSITSRLVINSAEYLQKVLDQKG